MTDDRRRIVRTLFVLGALLGLPSSAQAQTADASDRAQRLFVEASTLIEQGDFATACPKFEESQRLDPALGTQFNLALCQMRIGRSGSAFRNLRAVQKLAHSAGKSGREEAAREHLRELRERARYLVFTVADNNVTLRVDGELVERDDWSYYPVDPGEHAIEATAPARQPWRTAVQIPASGALAEPLTVKVPILPTAGGTRVVTVTAEGTNTRRVVGLSVGAVGVVGLGIAVATSIMIASAKSTADDQCTPRCSGREGDDAVDRGKSLLPFNAIAWGVAAVGLGVGGYLVLTSGRKSTAARVAPLVGPSAYAVGVSGSF
jgi:hypothetical protein